MTATAGSTLGEWSFGEVSDRNLPHDGAPGSSVLKATDVAASAPYRRGAHRPSVSPDVDIMCSPQGLKEARPAAAANEQPHSNANVRQDTRSRSPMIRPGSASRRSSSHEDHVEAEHTNGWHHDADHADSDADLHLRQRSLSACGRLSGEQHYLQLSAAASICSSKSCLCVLSPAMLMPARWMQDLQGHAQSCSGLICIMHPVTAACDCKVTFPVMPQNLPNFKRLTLARQTHGTHLM